MGSPFSEAEKADVWDSLERGEAMRAVARRLGRAHGSIRTFVVDHVGRRPKAAGSSTLRLSLAEREEISRGLAAGLSLRAIATGLGRAPLADFWSPEEISAWLARVYLDDPEMRVSHETIYMSLFVQGRGALRQELHRCLRTGRAMRRPKARTKGGFGQGQLVDMVMISERPAEAADRAVPGHWEGDLIMGRRMTAVGTLVERHSRYVMLFALPHGHTAEQVRTALAKQIQRLPAELRRSLTWDQGKEMAEHARFTIDTGVQVYFCDPKSPWQRGSNENTNGLLRQYLPKSTDLSAVAQTQLNAIARSLNRRPRQTLGWRTPSQALNDAVAMTA